MVTTSPSSLKAGDRSSCRRNEPLPLCPNRTQPHVINSQLLCPASRRQVMLQASVFSLTPSGVGCASIRTGPRLSPAPRRRFPQGASLEAADAGTRRLQAGPDRGRAHPKGTARAVLKAETYRLRPEGLPPAEMRHDLCRLYEKGKA